jgi:TonB family protein
MRLKGIVRVEAVVGNNGVVRSVGVKGGHPVLAQAAVRAVSKWKWEPASHETKEPVEVRFEPD